ncbi:uncharacterized protein WM294_009715 [Sarcoramphus papa]
MAGKPAPSSPAGSCAAASLAQRQSRCRAEGRAAPSSGVRGSSSLSSRILDGSGSAAPGRERLARLAALILSGRGRRRPASAGEPWLEQDEGLQQDMSGMLKSPVWGIFLQEGVVELLENGSSVVWASRLAKRFPRVSCLLCLGH